MSRHLLSVIFRHCWQRGGNQALIPPKGSIAAVVYSKDHGDLLISDDGVAPAVYNFTEKDRYGLDERSRILLTVKNGKYTLVR